VQVLEDEHERRVVRERLEEAPPRGEALALRNLLVVGGREPDQAPHPDGHPVGLPRIGGDPADGLVELGGGLVVGVGLEDAGLPLHDLCERPEAGAFAVGQRAPLPPGREVRLRLDRAEELVDEARLPDSRNADERDELEPSLAPRTVEGVAEEI